MNIPRLNIDGVPYANVPAFKAQTIEDAREQSKGYYLVAWYDEANFDPFTCTCPVIYFYCGKRVNIERTNP